MFKKLGFNFIIILSFLFCYNSAYGAVFGPDSNFSVNTYSGGQSYSVGGADVIVDNEGIYFGGDIDDTGNIYVKVSQGYMDGPRGYYGSSISVDVDLNGWYQVKYPTGGGDWHSSFGYQTNSVHVQVTQMDTLANWGFAGSYYSNYINNFTENSVCRYISMYAFGQSGYEDSGEYVVGILGELTEFGVVREMSSSTSHTVLGDNSPLTITVNCETKPSDMVRLQYDTGEVISNWGGGKWTQTITLNNLKEGIYNINLALHNSSGSLIKTQAVCTVDKKNILTYISDSLTSGNIDMAVLIDSNRYWENNLLNRNLVQSISNSGRGFYNIGIFNSSSLELLKPLFKADT